MWALAWDQDSSSTFPVRSAGQEQQNLRIEEEKNVDFDAIDRFETLECTGTTAACLKRVSEALAGV